MGGSFPQMNLDPRATPWGKEVQRRLLEFDTRFGRTKQSQDNASRASTSTQATLSAQVAVLQAVANVQYNEWSNNAGVNSGGLGWLPSRASVTISSPTGRLEVGFGGSLNSGNGVIAYHITGATSGVVASRDTVRANYAQRVALSGGASFISSGFNNVIVNVPKNETLTITAQTYSESTTTYFFGARILARVAP